MKKVLIGLAIFILAGITVVVTVLSLAGRDRPPPDVADLKVERIALPPEDNAYTFFVAATNTFYWPTNATLITDYLDGKTVDAGALADVLDQNTQMIESINRGTACKTCLAPEVTGFDTLLPHLSPWRNMGRVLAAKTRHTRLAGRYVQATESCIILLRFADLVQRDPECLIQYLVGIAIMDVGLSQAQELARDNNMPPVELTRLSAALAELSPSAPGLVRAIKVEYKVVANTTDQFRDGKFGMTELAGLSGDKPHPLLKGRRMPGYIFQPNATKETFANLYRNMIADAPLPFAEMKRIDVEKALGLKASRAEMLLRPNAVGRILYALLVPAMDNLLERRCRADCGVAATRIIGACHQYRNTSTRFPDDLEALVPEYLPGIPADPYDGKPFRYVASKKIVYSVGKDLRDSGGSTNAPPDAQEDSLSKRRWKADDVVYEIEEGIEQTPAGDVLKAAPEE